MRRLRVAYVPAALRPGGAERQMLALAERLPRDEFEVDFLVHAGTGEYDERGRASGARVRHIGSAPAADPSLPSRTLRRANRVATFIRVVRAARYDIVDAWLYPSDVLAALTRPITRTPIVISGRRNLDPHEQFGRAGNIVDRLALRLTDVVVANSSAAAAYALANEPLDRAKVRVIRNGVEPIRRLGAEERAALRRELGIEDDQLLVACVANYLPIKQHGLLVEAFETVARAIPSAHLVLIGEGPMRPSIESKVGSLGLGSRVRLLGSLTDPARLQAACDVAVQASRREGLPNALLEAAAAGRPIVATAAGGSGEIVVDGETGLLVPTDDVEALATALIRVLGDAQLRARLGEAARQRAAEAFGMDRFVAEFAALYRELATTRRLLG